MSTNGAMDKAFGLARLCLELLFRRSPYGYMLAAGIPMMGFSFGPTYQAVITSQIATGTTLSGSISSSDVSPWLSIPAFLFGFVLIIIGGWMAWQTFQSARRKEILVIELRGLSRSVDTPLETAIPWHIPGHRQPILFDIRQLVSGTIDQLQEALDMVNLLPSRLATYKNGRDRSDLVVYAGGLAPVPFLFLTGMLIDDESKTHWMEWDRNTNEWIAIESSVEAGLINLSLPGKPAGPEVVLAASISYPISDEVISKAFPHMSVAKLERASSTPGHSLSEEAIAFICQQFRDTVVQLQGQGVRHIHLLLAAPTTVVLRLGSGYDRRNMPAISVYQYEANLPNPYPWGINMPTVGQQRGSLKENT